MERYVSLIKGHFRNMAYKNSVKTGWQKLRQTLLAILFALVIASIMILSKGINPIMFFQKLTKGAFLNKDATERTWVTISIYITAGAAIIAGFKSGLFNIGVGGQMAISGTAAVIVGSVSNVHWSVLMLLAITVAILAAAIIAVLKAFFNIHEVVTAILLNYVLLYIAQYLLNVSNGWSYMSSTGTVVRNPSGNSIMRLSEAGGTHVLAIAISLAVVTIFAIIFKFTTLGYSLKGNGESPTASHYAGINVKKQTIIGMALSGMAAGALGAIYYLGYTNANLSSADVASLPSIGFEGISVALIASNSFLGLLPAAFFWGALTSGAAYTEIVIPAIPKEVVTLINGFVIYSIAISIIFARFKPFKLLTNLFLLFINDEFRKEHKKLKRAIKGQKQTIQECKKDIKSKLSDSEKTALEIKKLKLKINSIQKEINFKKKELKKQKVFKIKFGDAISKEYILRLRRIFGDYSENLNNQKRVISKPDASAMNKINAIWSIVINSCILPFKYIAWAADLSILFKVLRKQMLHREVNMNMRFELGFSKIEELTEEINALQEKTIKYQLKQTQEVFNVSKQIIKAEYNSRLDNILAKSREKTFVGKFWRSQGIRKLVTDKYVTLRREENLKLSDEISILKSKKLSKEKFTEQKNNATKKCVANLVKIDAQEKAEKKKLLTAGGGK